jgi:hypothetical protein
MRFMKSMMAIAAVCAAMLTMTGMMMRKRSAAMRKGSMGMGMRKGSKGMASGRMGRHR